MEQLSNIWIILQRTMDDNLPMERSSIISFQKQAITSKRDLCFLFLCVAFGEL